MRLIVGYFFAIAVLLGGLYSFGAARAEAANAEAVMTEAGAARVMTTETRLVTPDDKPVESQVI